jgi:hypothetical protein
MNSVCSRDNGKIQDSSVKRANPRFEEPITRANRHECFRISRPMSLLRAQPIGLRRLDAAFWALTMRFRIEKIRGAFLIR